MTDALTPVLVGDVGGTSTRFALDDGVLHSLVERPTVDSPDLHTALAPVLHDLGTCPARAVIAVAGPVDDGRVRLTNGQWTADVRRQSLPCTLLNDLAAAAHGLPLVPKHLCRQVGGRPPEAAETRAVIGVGTGHGQAMWIEGTAISGEGGHAAFASPEPELSSLCTFIARGRPCVTIEDVVSGNALSGLLDFVSKDLGPAARKMRSTHSAGAVIEAFAASDPGCERAMRLFVSALGAVARDFALRVLPKGGIWLVGGVVEHLLSERWNPLLRDSFEGSGPTQGLLRSFPLLVVQDSSLGLRGAVVVARAGMR
jgi:glucokinase